MLRVLQGLVVLVLVLGLTAGNVRAAGDQDASFQDNSLLSNPAAVGRTLGTLRSLGVDRLVVSVVWDKVAPEPNRRLPPLGFDGADPADYPSVNWAAYDRIAEQAKAAGLSVNFDVMGGAPLWAVGRAPTRGMARVWYPSPQAFGAFVSALGERYSGRYTPSGAARPLPRVDYWSVWNEPNFGSGSLAPQVANGVEVAPALYRSLLDAAWSALLSTGHGPNTDTILVGQTAATGQLVPGFDLSMQPLRFLRALYCVNSGYRPLRGAAAQRRGCPTTAAGSRSFAAQHPALFDATGWGHHPYWLGVPPTTPPPALVHDWVTLENLPSLEDALDRVRRDYGSARRLPLYLTEYGNMTDPPRPGVGISPALQATYLNEAEYIAWRDPRVRTFAQYLLQDPASRRGDPSFATGLIYSDGVRKPSYAAYRLPVWMPATVGHRGEALEVWGCVRPAKLYRTGTTPPVRIQLDGRTLRSVPITNREGYIDTHVVFPHGGTVRLAWRTPGGHTLYSRAVALTVNSPTSTAANGVMMFGVAAPVLLLGGLVVRRRRRAMQQLRRALAEPAFDRRIADCPNLVTRQNVIAVVGPRGGTGKTPVAYTLASALAWYARLNVIVVDYGYRGSATPVDGKDRSALTLTDLVAQADGAVPLSRLREFASSTPCGMMMLAGPAKPSLMRGVTRADLDRLLDRLANADVVVLDCGAGVTRDRARWAIERADQCVVVARPEDSKLTATATALIGGRGPKKNTWPVLSEVQRNTRLAPIRRVFDDAGLGDPIEIPDSNAFVQNPERATYPPELLPRSLRVPIKQLAARVVQTLS